MDRSGLGGKVGTTGAFPVDVDGIGFRNEGEGPMPCDAAAFDKQGSEITSNSFVGALMFIDTLWRHSSNYGLFCIRNSFRSVTGQ